MKLRKTELWAIVLTAVFLTGAGAYRLGRRGGAAEVTVSRAAVATFSPALPEASPEPAAASEPPEGPVDLNTAGVEELKRLDGVGDALAARIVEDREANGPFASVEDITRVSGIGQKILDSNRGRLTVGGG
ncbi:MAG: helix-hairpin-helix domain-containing protein [Oscillospiraceae bacterium]|nr:helix-hairpin-helix domain-containing protein [Oscillospiraceae bacterium]